MAKTGFLIPILPGKEQLATTDTSEEMRRRISEYEQSRKSAGISLERVFLQRNPDGTNLIVVYNEMNRSLEDVAGAFASSEADFDKWFVEMIKEVSGIDLSVPPQGEPPEHIASWEAPGSPRGKGLAFASPLQARKLDEMRLVAKEAFEVRRDEWSESRAALGLTRSEVFVNHTPQGEVVITYIEGEDPVESNRQFAASAKPFDRWFKDRLKDIFPPFVDFDQPAPKNETLWDWIST